MTANNSKPWFNTWWGNVVVLSVVAVVVIAIAGGLFQTSENVATESNVASQPNEADSSSTSTRATRSGEENDLDMIGLESKLYDQVNADGFFATLDSLDLAGSGTPPEQAKATFFSGVVSDQLEYNQKAVAVAEFMFSNYDFSRFNMSFESTVEDRYGNQSQEPVITYTITENTADKINWNNYNPSQFCNLLQSEPSPNNCQENFSQF